MVDNAPPIPDFGNLVEEPKVQPEEGGPIFRLPGEPVPKSLKEWEETPSSEIAKQAIYNLPTSAWHAVTALPEAVINYEQTGQALKDIGTGIASKARGYLSDQPQDPAQKARDERLLNAMIEPYQSVGGLKKALATDPFSVLSTAALPLTGGAAGLLKAGEVVGKTSATAGKLLTGAGKAADYASTLMDPTKAALRTGEAIYEGIAKPAATTLASKGTGIPVQDIQTAYKAGAEADPVLRDTFNKYAQGKGDPIEFSQITGNASKKWLDDQITNWASDKKKYFQQTQTDVDLKPVFDAIQAERSKLTPSQFALGPHKQASDLLNTIERNFININNLPAGHPAKKIEALDKVKQELWDLKDAQRVRASENAVAGVHNGVLDAIGNVSPEYKSIMGNYQTILDKNNTITKTLGTGDRVAANDEMSRFIRQHTLQDGNSLIGELAKHDPRIPYMVAGASIAKAAQRPVGSIDALIKMSEIPANIFAYMHSPQIFASLLGATAAKEILTSPTAVTKIPYFAGRIAESPYGKALQATAAGAELGREAATGASAREQAAINDLIAQGYRPLTIPRRATGGRVTAEKLVQMAEQAKKAVNKTTEPLLQKDDTSVARALEVANKHIEG